MANNLAVNPVVIDTVAADVVISNSQVKVSDVVFNSAAAPGKIVLIDNLGNIKFILEVVAAGGGNDSLHFDNPIWITGLVVDNSASTFPANSTLLIYV